MKRFPGFYMYAIFVKCIRFFHEAYKRINPSKDEKYVLHFCLSVILQYILDIFHFDST